jgi:NAD(P)-dependent dehydrogenase (short-subunit alcohol dehydrogenase family)
MAGFVRNGSALRADACRFHQEPDVGLLDHKIALITGAARGLGAAMAAGFVREGAAVILADRDVAGAQRTADALVAAGGRASAVALDVTDRAAVAACAEQVQAVHGGIDILVNNAGIAGGPRFDDPATPAAWDRVIGVNLQGCFEVSHAFVPLLKARRGCVVNVSSIVAFATGVSSTGYVVSKGGVRSLTQVMARDLAPFGIRVNAVAPGLMDTDMAAPQVATEGGTDWFTTRAPLGRLGTADEIVGPVIFLASAMATYVTGVVLPVDGGFLAA